MITWRRQFPKGTSGCYYQKGGVNAGQVPTEGMLSLRYYGISSGTQWSQVEERCLDGDIT